MQHEIYYITEHDINDIQNFIDLHWHKGHILATSKPIFDFQYKKQGKYEFIIARNKKNEAIDAVLGYSTYGYLSEDNISVVCLALWKRKDDIEQKNLGILLLQKLAKDYKEWPIGTIGANDLVLPIYKALGFTVGQATHYYYASSRLTNFSIAVNPIVTSPKQNGNLHFTNIEDITTIPTPPHSIYPIKTKEYLQRRYQNHPVYKYKFYGIGHNDNIDLIFVTRKIQINDSACLRVVDIAGSPEKITNCQSIFESLLEQEQCEYIDCYNWGMAESIFFNMGFIIKSGNTVIPNYFEPFEQKNITLNIAIKNHPPNFTFFRGDGDQDRPNL